MMKKFLLILLTLTLLAVSIVSPSVYAVDTSLTDEYHAETTPDPMETIESGDNDVVTRDEQTSLQPSSGVIQDSQESEEAVTSTLSNTITDANVEAGVYRIRSVYSSLYIDIHGPSMSSGALIHQWTLHTDTSELWEISRYANNTDYYTIRSLYSGLYLGVTGHAEGYYNVVQLSPSGSNGSTHSDNTLWKIYMNEDGQFVLISKRSEMFMTALSSLTTINGNELEQTTYTTGSAEQFWWLENMQFLDDGVYFFANVSSNHYAQVNDESTSGSHIELYDYDGETDQQWGLTYQDNGYYTIVSYGGYYLTAPSTLDSNITLENYTGASNQMWMLTPLGNEIFTLTPKSNYQGYMAYTGLDLFINGRNIKLSEYRSDENDEWMLIYAPPAYSFGSTDFSEDGKEAIDAASNWKKCKYNSKYIISPSTSDIIGNLNSDIVYFSAHGFNQVLYLDNTVTVSSGVATNVGSNNVNISNYVLDNAKLFIYDACSTASTNHSERNICYDTYAAGADCVVGWPVDILVEDAERWQGNFQSKLVSGRSVNGAVDYANEFSYIDNSSIKSVQVYGNGDIIIKRNDLSFSQSTTQTNVSISEVSALQTESARLCDENSVKEFLSQNFDNFSACEANMTLTYINGSTDDYVIDYYYLHNGFKTKSGYSIIVRDGKVKCARDNTIPCSDNSFQKDIIIPEITDSIVNEAKSIAVEKIEDKYIDCTFNEQTGEGYYDIETSTYYYRVLTTYTFENGSRSVDVFLYKLN